MEVTANQPPIERYVRIAITKNTKGYSYESTVSLRWTGEIAAHLELDDLNRTADKLARLEIARREDLDNWKANVEADLEGIK